MQDKQVAATIAAYKKEIAALKKLIASVPPLPKDFDPKALPANEQLAYAEAEKALVQARRDLEELETKAKATMAAIAKEGQSLLAVVTKGLAQVLKDYQAAVKASDGLTTQRPKTVAALQKASKDKTPAAIATASAAVGQHLKEAEAVAKKSNDAADKKKIKAFAAGIAKVRNGLAAL